MSVGDGYLRKIDVQEQEDLEMIEDPVDSEADKISSKVNKADAEVEVEKNEKPDRH